METMNARMTFVMRLPALRRSCFRLLMWLFLLGLAAPLSAQRVAVKSNLLYDATTTLNLGAEIGLSPQWTLDLSANYNPFSFSDSKKWKHWLAQPEARYWFCERFNGHFVGMHLLGGQFNVGNVKFPLGIYPSTENYRYEGWSAGAGVSYGYQWLLGNRWNLEASVGVGYVHSWYDKYECEHCGEEFGKDNKGLFSVTKVALSISYIIK